MNIQTVNPFGVSSMTARLRKVGLRKPGPAMQKADPSIWHYGPTFDREALEPEHAGFTHLLEKAGVEIHWMDQPNEIADAVFSYDASLMTPQGAILMNPGKVMRRGEQLLHREFYNRAGIPVIGGIQAPGHSEAGDTLWLQDDMLAVGRGFRSNRAGLDQLADILKTINIEVREFDLPVYTGADACLHLMSLISLVDTRIAAVCLSLLPVGLYELLAELGYEILALPMDEFEQSGTLSGNIMAVTPGQCFMVDGYPKTLKLLEGAGIDVKVYDGQSLCVGCEGGPTCLTRPLLRED
jgi:dimethylargininase